jgi:hypothetical protein
MLTTTLYIFIFSSWGLGLLAALAALSMKLQEHAVSLRSMSLEVESDTLELSGKQAFVNRMAGGRGSRSIPDELKELMGHSPDHPEVNEIDGDDEVYGVVFKAHSYPPSMDTEDDDDE